ncbi:hypothetical protein [Herbiconiux flava]|uniref:Uncharacterized protein n=1 Tax=Herbiconiux flava TaxID=881268 RepID=A0A852SRC8_9MICO|nr:hypothetical protein [Herbiconiux flava]NYD71260.1 hypothetical protein [Herbiconiux flava]GLK18776.1 hypothetical protein GCM10017602_32580 [Herbiconiux flava]
MTNPAPPFPSARPARRPPPGWPFWLAFALLIVPGLIALSALGGAHDAAVDRLAQVRDVVDRDVVVTGTLVDVETNSGLPTNQGQYEAVIPDARGGPGTTVTLGGDDHWGFPPDPDHPARLDFLVVLDDPPHAIAHGPVGTVAAVTPATVADAEQSVDRTRVVWIVAVVVFWAAVVTLPALAILFSVRRRRARATGRRMPVPRL